MNTKVDFFITCINIKPEPVMKTNMRKFARELAATLLGNPVETLLSIALLTLSVLTWKEILDTKLGENVLLAPLFFTVSFVLNRLGRERKSIKVLYWISVLQAVLLFTVKAAFWVSSPAYPASLIIAVALVASYNFKRDNTSFVRNFIAYAREIIFALIIATAIFLSILAIFHSISYLFGVFEESLKDITFYASTTCYLFIAPVAFLQLNSKAGEDEEKRLGIKVFRIFELVINYILSPAIFIYTIILYVYIAGIVFEMSLPKGNLAYMVIAFVISFFAIKSILPLLERPLFVRIYESASLISILPLTIFWIGTIYRISEYGYTAGRVYLIVCGLILSLSVILYLIRHMGRLLYVAWITIVLLSVFTYIKPISAKQTGIDSQLRILKELATELEISGEDGRLFVPDQLHTDSAEVKKFDRMSNVFDYLADELGYDKMKQMYGYGSRSELRTFVGEKFRITCAVEQYVLERTKNIFPVEGYSKSYFEISCRIDKDSLSITNSKDSLLLRIPNHLLETLSATAISKRDSLLKAGIKPCNTVDSLLNFSYMEYMLPVNYMSISAEGTITSVYATNLLVK